MQNFWLKRRKKRVVEKRLGEVNAIVQAVINNKIRQLKGGGQWRRKKDTKTQP